MGKSNRRYVLTVVGWNGRYRRYDFFEFDKALELYCELSGFCAACSVMRLDEPFNLGSFEVLAISHMGRHVYTVPVVMSYVLSQIDKSCKAGD